MSTNSITVQSFIYYNKKHAQLMDLKAQSVHINKVRENGVSIGIENKVKSRQICTGEQQQILNYTDPNLVYLPKNI